MTFVTCAMGANGYGLTQVFLSVSGSARIAKAWRLVVRDAHLAAAGS